MEGKVIDISGNVKGAISLPYTFTEDYRPDLIKRAVLAAQANRLQPYGVSPLAGLLTSAKGWGTGRGASRVARLNNSSRAARAPQTRGGRRAHPPKAEKVLSEKINTKERRKAIRSAIGATTSSELISARGHKFNPELQLPIIIEDKIEDIARTNDVRDILETINLWKDVLRAKRGRTIRAGRGKLRGRKYKKRKSILFVTSKNCSLFKAARNLSGVDVVSVDCLNAELLAPGTHAGRLTVWTESAVNALEGLYT